MLAQLTLEDGVERAGEGRVERLGVDGLGNNAVVLEDIHNHVPLPAVADEILRGVEDNAVIDWEVGVLDGELEVVVGLVQLVPEEQI